VTGHDRVDDAEGHGCELAEENGPGLPRMRRAIDKSLFAEAIGHEISSTDSEICFPMLSVNVARTKRVAVFLVE
jgi:hypothetical protein